MDLDDVLSDKPKEPVVEAPEPQEPKVETVEVNKGNRKAFQDKEAAAQAEGRARGPDGKFTAADPEPPKEPEKPAEPAKPVQQEMTEKEKAFLAQATDERRKRQQLEQRLAQLEAQQPQKPTEPAKTFYDDPDAALSAFEKRILEQGQQQQQSFTQQRIAIAEAAARSRYQDFDEVIPMFGEMLQTTPGLYQQWLASTDPGDFAYRSAKGLKELRDAGSVDAIKVKAEKEARIKLEAEYKAKEAALTKAREAIPESLSDARGTSQPRVTWGGPPSLDDVLQVK